MHVMKWVAVGLLASLTWFGLPPGVAVAQSTSVSQAATRQFASAAALQNRQQYELAADEWQKFLQLFAADPRANDARYYVGLCRLKLNQFAPAAEALQQVIADAKKAGRPFDLLPSAYLYLGLAQYKLAESGHPTLFKEADETFAKLLEQFPKDNVAAEARLYRGEALYAQGKKAEAAQLYQEIADQNTASDLLPQALYALGVTRQDLHEHAAAERTYSDFLKRFATHRLADEVTMRRAEALYELGKIDEAQTLFASVAGKPGFALADHALMGQADSLFARRKYTEAAQLYEQLPQKFGNSSLVNDAKLAAGKCRILAGQSEQARALLQPLVGGEPAVAVEAAHWLSRALIKDAEAAEALKVVEAALDQQPGDWTAQLELDRADALYELADRRDEARQAYAAVAKNHPKSDAAPQALYMAAFAAVAAGDHDAALESIEQFAESWADDPLLPEVQHLEAEARLRRGDHKQAAALYQQLVDRYSNHTDVDLWRVRRGLALWLGEQYKDTIAALEPVAASLGSKPLTAEAQWLLGSSRQRLGDQAAAIKALEASLAADAQWRQADQTLLALAAAYQAAGDSGKAIDRTRQLIERYSNSKLLDEAHFRLAEYLTAAGQQEQAAEAYRRMLEGWPQSTFAPHALYDLGWIELRQGNTEQAADTFTRLLDKHKSHELAARARYSRGLARQQLQKYEDAVDDLEKFLSGKPSSEERADARYVLARSQVGLGDPKKAAATLEALLKDKPDYVDADRALYELGWAYKELGNASKAAEAFGRLADKHAKSALAAESSYHVGEAAYQEEDYRRAAVAYHKAMNAAGEATLAEKAAHKLGWAYFHQGEFEKAQQTFAYQRSKYAGGTLVADAYFMEGESLFKLGKYREALAAYQQVKNPSVAEFARLALIGGGKAASELQQYDTALQLLTQAADQAGESEDLPEILFEQGRVKHRQGKLDEALELYEQVTAASGGEVAARSRLLVGEIYFEKKDHAEAIRNFFKVAYGYSYPQWQAEAHYEAGRCFEVLGKTDQARQSYQEVVTSFANSDKAPLAQQRLDALGPSK